MDAAQQGQKNSSHVYLVYLLGPNPDTILSIEKF